jgi:hypothetical protein
VSWCVRERESESEREGESQLRERKRERERARALVASYRTLPVERRGSSSSAYVSIRQHTSAYVSICQVVYLAGGKKGVFLSIETFACSFEGEALNLYVDLLQRICAQIHTTQTQTQTQTQTPVHMSRTSSNFTSERSYTRAGLSHTHAHAHKHADTHTSTHKRTHAHTHTHT